MRNIRIFWHADKQARLHGKSVAGYTMLEEFNLLTVVRSNRANSEQGLTDLPAVMSMGVQRGKKGEQMLPLDFANIGHNTNIFCHNTDILSKYYY